MSKPLKFKKVYGPVDKYKLTESPFLITPSILESTIIADILKQMEVDMLKNMGLSTNAVVTPSPTLTLESLKTITKEFEDNLYIGKSPSSLDEIDLIMKKGFKLNLITFTYYK